ncbi:hypothetical protein BANORC5_06190 [Bacteroides nordii]|nr:hypothetical protein BANORC5_06190 [Bacteroides nordii]
MFFRYKCTTVGTNPMFENNFIYSKNVPNAPVFQFCSKEKNKNNKDSTKAE